MDNLYGLISQIYCEGHDTALLNLRADILEYDYDKAEVIAAIDDMLNPED